MKTQAIQRPPAEELYREELDRLADWDSQPAPPGWRLSPLAVEKFVAGDDNLAIEPKFVAPRTLLTRVIVGLLTNRGAMLVGEPGTAKSWLSEILAAAISGESTLIVQGGAVSSLNQLLYSWNDALLQNEGPSLKALIPGPVYRAMKEGKIVRYEEIARSSTEIQDGILSILSERLFIVPELGTKGTLFAKAGFNIVATSNNLDKGVTSMSAALKRRLNFETVYPIADLHDEFDVVQREAYKLLDASGIETKLDKDLLLCLVTIFHELREGQSIDGRSTDRLAGTSMSTAEAISVAHALGTYAHYYRNGKILTEDLVHFLIGAALKDNPEDRRRLRHYFETEIGHKSGRIWQEIYQNRICI